jgi:hypothetical protein
MKKEAEYPNLNRKTKKIFRLLKQGHIIICNEGTTEFRFRNNCFEVRFLNGTAEWILLDLEEMEEEADCILSKQGYLIDRKDRIYIHFEVKFCWYDFWIGFYWDRKNKILHFCPFPTVVFCFHFYRKTIYCRNKE